MMCCPWYEGLDWAAFVAVACRRWVLLLPPPPPMVAPLLPLHQVLPLGWCPDAQAATVTTAHFRIRPC